jgi:S-DNA-T family DNA segregation ATPase FtsK/SpoIIIE
MRTSKSNQIVFIDKQALNQVIQRNISGASGLILLMLVALSLLALATWTVDDPSLNHATDKIPDNMLGYAGAIVSDLFMQIFGLGSVAFFIPVAFWGWALAFYGTINREKSRLVLWFLAITMACLFLACLPIPQGWPLPLGLGGIVGDFLLLPLTVLLGSSALIYGATALLAASLGLVSLWRCATLFDIHDTPLKSSSSTKQKKQKETAVGHGYDDFEDDDMDDEEAGENWSSRLAPILGGAYHLGRVSLIGTLRGVRFIIWENSNPFSLRSLWLARQTVTPEPVTLTSERRVEPGFNGPVNAERDEPAFFTNDNHAYTMDFDEGDEDAHHNWHEGAENDTFSQMPELDRHASGHAPLARKKGRPNLRLISNNVFEKPPVAMLAPPPARRNPVMSKEALERNARMLEGVLEDFGVKGQIINVRPGPVVTLYELEPAPGIKSSRVIGLADDIARSMSAISARVAVIPGRNAIGIELPNARRETVFLREMIDDKDFNDNKSKLALTLGQTIGGEAVIADLARMPHLLVAGTTGSGKSVSINTMILSLLYRLTPEQCRMIMIDPKMLELSIYEGIPHLLTPVVTDPKKAVVALKWAVREMEERYRNMSKLGVRNIDGYNARVKQANKRGETLTRTVQTGFDKETGEPIYEREELNLEPMPFIVIIVDEMADLMMVAGKDIEGAIQRLAQMARAAGIHLIMATQRPSVDVITGTIKANFPTRISFQVTSKIDSRTILGEMGAEQLLGQGDMLFMAGGGRIQRVHGPFVSDEEVENIVAHLKTQGIPEYLDSITDDDDDEDGGNSSSGTSFSGGDSDDDKSLYEKAVEIVIRDKKASTSYIQRRLSVGYNKAATLIEQMEDQGIISPANHAGKREILIECEE